MTTALKTLKCFTFSDLHKNARGSRYEEIGPRLMEEIANADVIILDGDIIEMYYPHHLAKGLEMLCEAFVKLINDKKTWSGDFFKIHFITKLFALQKAMMIEAYEKAAEDGVAWVKYLIEKHPDKKFLYLEGNHENCDIFHDGIRALRDAHGNLIWGRTYMKIGNAHFSHGDTEIKNEVIEKREKIRFADVVSGNVNEAANLSLEYPVMGIMQHVNNHKRVIHRIYSFLQRVHPERLDGIEHMFIGHTHLPFTALERFGMKWYNTGSATRFGRDNYLTFDLVLPENCEFRYPTDKRVFYQGAQVTNVRRVDLGGRYSEMVRNTQSAVATSR